jgi:glutaconyl-CoA/methylmalonyl-CoA decarboxylase subunit delta
MNVFTLILYMYAIAAAISFFVAFVISAIYWFIKFSERGFKFRVAIPPLSTTSIKEVQIEAAQMDQEAELMAAIAFALHLYSQDMHDVETMKSTIIRSAKPYSPWSSKIYGLNTYKR